MAIIDTRCIAKIYTAVADKYCLCMGLCMCNTWAFYNCIDEAMRHRHNSIHRKCIMSWRRNKLVQIFSIRNTSILVWQKAHIWFQCMINTRSNVAACRNITKFTELDYYYYYFVTGMHPVKDFLSLFKLFAQCRFSFDFRLKFK